MKEINRLIYECFIKDFDGNRNTFSAHGLDQVTGSLNTAIGRDLMRKLFQNVPGAHKMCGAYQVD